MSPRTVRGLWIPVFAVAVWLIAMGVHIDSLPLSMIGSCFVAASLAALLHGGVSSGD